VKIEIDNLDLLFFGLRLEPAASVPCLCFDAFLNVASKYTDVENGRGSGLEQKKLKECLWIGIQMRIVSIGFT
jgi:hypothetical protein